MYVQASYMHIHLLTEVSTRELVAHLKEKDKLLPVNQSFAPSSTTNRPSLSMLAIPNPPPPCNQDDFQGIQFWTRSRWNLYVDKENENGRNPSKLGFICDKDGNTVSDARLATIGKEANQLWAELYRERQDPLTWSGKTQSAADFFNNSMHLKFEEFRYCDHNWKIEAFATIRYPDFVRNKAASGRLACE